MKILEKYLVLNPCYAINMNPDRDPDMKKYYLKFQTYGPKGGMLHSTGCAQPSAEVFYVKWNKPSYYSACVHGFIDANTGDVWETLPWNYRGWHCGGSANNTHIGVEMCESKWIRYLLPGEEGYAPAKFIIIDKKKAQADCRRAYDSAVELFAMLGRVWNWNPLTDIISHKEGGQQGIASGHADPEHYWTQLEMPYTMDRFRFDVKNKMEDILDMTRQELNKLVEDTVNLKLGKASTALVEEYSKNLNAAVDSLNESLNERLGPEMIHVKDIPWPAIRKRMQKLVDKGYINGGTPAEVDPNDIRLPLNLVRILAVCDAMIEDVEKEIAQIATKEVTSDA